MVGWTPFATVTLAPARTIVLYKPEVFRAFLIARRLTLARSAADFSTFTRVLEFLAFRRELALAFLFIKVIVSTTTSASGSTLTATRVPIEECRFATGFNFGAGLQAPAVS
jgi:hypothetical protein